MAIIIKNESEIQKMRDVCAIVRDTLLHMESKIEPGISTAALDKIARDYIVSRNAIPTSKNYRGFPGNVCISVNEEVIHGIPGIRKIKDGDIVSIDIGVTFNGFVGDAARTFLCANVPDDVKKLVAVTRESFFEGVKHAFAGQHLYEISGAIEEHVVKNGFSVVKDFVGHGIGKKYHEDPEIPNYKPQRRGPRLMPGMTLAIEPMVNMGVSDVVILEDDWTVVTKDGKRSAHYENTVLITDNEPEILTL